MSDDYPVNSLGGLFRSNDTTVKKRITPWVTDGVEESEIENYTILPTVVKKDPLQHVKESRG